MTDGAPIGILAVLANIPLIAATMGLTPEVLAAGGVILATPDPEDDLS